MAPPARRPAADLLRRHPGHSQHRHPRRAPLRPRTHHRSRPGPRRAPGRGVRRSRSTPPRWPTARSTRPRCSPDSDGRTFASCPPTTRHALRPDALEDALRRDVAAGQRPCAIVATVGTTGTTALDPVARIGELARAHGAWLHVDAALAGTAMACPELRWMWDGVDQADSVVWNPHKWLGIGFDCTAYHVRDPDHLVRVMSTDPTYLRTSQDGAVKNYRDWGIALGRRFRALKVWFVLSALGVEGVRAEVRRHIALAQALALNIDTTPGWERLAPVPAADRRLPAPSARAGGQGGRRAQPRARRSHQCLGTGLPHPGGGEGRAAPPGLGGSHRHHRRRRRGALDPARRDGRGASTGLTPPHIGQWRVARGR